MKPILKGKKIKVRILRPSEYEQLRKAVEKKEDLINLDCCLLLGARYEECVEIQKHPEWFDNNFVYLPHEKKVKRKSPDRYIRLSSAGQMILPHFFGNKPLPTPQGFRDNLIRWAKKSGLDPIGLCPRTLRKTWESWLVYYYPDQIHAIFLSQGHTELTSLNHYINMPFTEDDKKLMKKWVDGWI